MIGSVSKVLLWLFIINLGVALGAGLYESRIVFPQWLDYSPDAGYRWNADAARQANTGLRFWVYMTTVPLTLLTVANGVAAFRPRGSLRRWWLVAGAAALGDGVFTFGYFIPTMVRLWQPESMTAQQAVATAMQWDQLNYIRHALTLAALLAALKAFSLVSRSGN